jgi:hypothetical protein
LANRKASSRLCGKNELVLTPMVYMAETLETRSKPHAKFWLRVGHHLG